ncbi:MAG: META domain-containing protein [Chloroflexota bacterium]|nr:META domain-containing protein [Chloroflexota bacterium]MDE2684401.1 META domain-containing protein [Chloroflexota bacterium]
MLFRKVMLIMAVMLLIIIACTGAPVPTPPTPTETVALEPTATALPLATATAVPEPTPTKLPIDGATWILESIDGQPPIKGTHLTLTVNETWFGGFDGCNDFGGRHESGQPVIERDGTISLPPTVRTLQGCVTPPGILDQADRYLDAMKQDARARVVGDHLHILDGSGEVVLVFAREQPLVGQPRDLVGTSWRLVNDEAIYGGGEAATLLFLNSWAATGTTICRDYYIGYTASDGRIRIPSMGMSGSGERCSNDVSRQEHQYIEDFGWADEYSMQQAEESKRLVVRTSRGKTLTFELLPQRASDIFSGSWRLIRLLESRSDGSGMRWPDNTDVSVSENITATFDEESIEGSLGRASCVYRAVGQDGTPLVRADQTISIATASVTESCDDGVSVSPKQQWYLDVLPTAERYTVFGERLVIITSDGGALIFQPE